jgi:mannose-6-phosphate isomerase-like protein (cupin superfamily)
VSSLNIKKAGGGGRQVAQNIQEGAKPILVFRYERPELHAEDVKAVVNICRTKLISAAVQVVKKGGETVLHAHNTEDEAWFVLAGRAAFYDSKGGRVELTRNEGVIIEASVPYWFESLGDEPLEILRVAGRDAAIAPKPSNPVPPGRAEAVIVSATTRDLGAEA